MTGDDDFQRPHPNTLNCADCGHVWFDGERRHQYVDAAGEVSVEKDADAVCVLCHQKRRRPRSDDADDGLVRYW